MADVGPRQSIINDRQLARLLGGSDDRRYGLVKRALKTGGLIQLKRTAREVDIAVIRIGEHHSPNALSQTIKTSDFPVGLALTVDPNNLALASESKTKFGELIVV